MTIIQQTNKWKKLYLSGPMRPVISVTTRKDGYKNQIITDINYDENALSIFLKKELVALSDSH